MKYNRKKALMRILHRIGIHWWIDVMVPDGYREQECQICYKKRSLVVSILDPTRKYWRYDFSWQEFLDNSQD